jgi:hypothetical protein
MVATGASGGDDSEIEPLGTGRPLEMIKDVIIHETGLAPRTLAPVRFMVLRELAAKLTNRPPNASARTGSPCCPQS